MPDFKRLSAVYKLDKTKKTKPGTKKSGSPRHPFVIPVISFLIIFFTVLVALVMFGGQNLDPSDTHVVSLSLNGQTSTIPTRASTVGDLLKRLDINVEKEDLVEPTADTQILEDNFKVTYKKAQPVTLNDNGRKVTVLTPYEEPQKIAQAAGIKLYQEDALRPDAQPSTEKDLVVGPQYLVDRAKVVNINLYGNPFTVRTRSGTVDEVLREKNIKFIEGDTLEPAKSAKITSNMSIFIVRVGKKVITEEVAIPAPVNTVDDPNLAFGATAVVTPGSNGKKLVTYEVDLKNGKEVSRRAIQEVIASEPVTRVVSRGTKVLLTGGKEDWLVAAGISPNDYAAVDYIVSRESGWCPTKWQGQSGGCPAYHGTPSSNIGYGLCQATPGYKMATAGADWNVNPVTQLRWCSGYAQKYGGWQGAYRFWIVNRWW